jgi:hypothetical protein
MLLPDPQRRGEIHFWFVRTLSYEVRFHAILVLLTAGLVTQTVSLRYEAYAGVLLGAAFLLAATALSLVKGYTNKPSQMRGAREWRSADAEHLARIIRISRKARSWDQSFLDITCWLGCAGLLAVLAMVGFGFLFLLTMGQDVLAQIWLLDACILLPPHWITGVRRVLTNDPLTIKARMLLEVINTWQPSAQPGEKAVPQMEVLNTPEGQIPQDAKLVLQMDGLGESFLGVQVQVVLNNVQGADYPYLYCVLVARPDLKIHEQLQPDPPLEIVAEAEQQDDVDILIIRQHTTKTSGYHTDSHAAKCIFGYALSQARHLRPS